MTAKIAKTYGMLITCGILASRPITNPTPAVGRFKRQSLDFVIIFALSVQKFRQNLSSISLYHGLKSVAIKYLTPTGFFNCPIVFRGDGLISSDRYILNA